MVPFDTKERFLLEIFKSKFQSRSFEEIDVNSFLIFLRSHFEKNEKSLFSYYHDCGNLVAHRKRSAGIALQSIQSAIDNHYSIKSNSTEIQGYNGIDTMQWNEQWLNLGKAINISFTNEIIREITLCVLSILQFSQYSFPKSSKNISSSAPIGVMYLIQGKDQLVICSHENKPTSPYVTYCKLDKVSFIKRYDNFVVKDATYAKREAGVLRLINDKGNYIIQMMKY